MASTGMVFYIRILAKLFTIVPVFCSTRELKWVEDTDRANLNFPTPVFILKNSSLGHCLSMCSSEEGCDGVTFMLSGLVCRGHALYDVSDVRNGVASPGTRMWTNANCRRTDYIYIVSMDWCVKLTVSVIPITRTFAEQTCTSEKARLVWVDSRAKHDELVKMMFVPLVPWFVAGDKVGGVWKLDDGSPVIADADLWNPLPPVPLLSNCLCYFTNQLWPCLCLTISGFICEEA